MTNANCPECGAGPLAPRASGMWWCRDCGHLAVQHPNAEPQVDAPVRPVPAVPDTIPEWLTEGAEAPKAGEMTVPDFTEVCVGWRAWALNPNVNVERGELPLLQSVSQREQFWQPREAVVAECLSGREHHGKTVPVESCHCGLYAARTLAHLMGMGYPRDASRDGMLVVVGTVSLWGKVVPGTQGYRAQFSYPRELAVPFEGWKLGKQISEAYGVPVRLRNVFAQPDEEGV